MLSQKGNAGQMNKGHTESVIFTQLKNHRVCVTYIWLKVCKRTNLQVKIELRTNTQWYTVRLAVYHNEFFHFWLLNLIYSHLPVILHAMRAFTAFEKVKIWESNSGVNVENLPVEQLEESLEAFTLVDQIFIDILSILFWRKVRDVWKRSLTRTFLWNT